METEDLIIRYYSNQLSQEEKQQLLKIVEEDTSAYELFKDYAMMTNAFPSPQADHTEAYSQFLQKAETPEKKGRTIKMRYFSIAASVAAAVVLAIFFIAPDADLQYNTIALQAEKNTFTLPDNSTIDINKNTSIEYAESFGNNRAIKLNKGEAYFEVQKDADHPFTVETPRAKITVLGTGFNVKLDSISGNTTVTVLHGKVKVENKKSQQSQILVKNQTATLAQTSTEFSSPASSTANELSWKTNTIEFKNTPMTEVVQILNNHFGSQLQIKQGELKNCRLNTGFEDPNLETILDMLETFNQVKSEKQGDKIILTGPGC